MKKLILFISILSASTSLCAQQTQDHFLWFCGHWSTTKKNTFITTACTDTIGGNPVQMGGGSTITVSPGGSVTINSPGIDDWNKKFEEGENSIDKTIKDLKSNEKEEWAYHLNEMTMPWLQDLKKQWEQMKINKTENILNPQNNKAANTPKSKGFQIYSDICTNLMKDYDIIMAYYEEHKKDKPSDYWNPPPPPHVFTCHSCDTTLVKEERKADSIYVIEFMKPESYLVRKALGIKRFLILIRSLLPDDIRDQDLNDPDYKLYEQLFYHNNNDPSQSGPCFYLKSDQLNHALKFLLMRVYRRAVKLVQDHKNDVHTATPVIRTYLEVARQLNLMGIQVDNNFEELAGLIKKVFDFNYNKLVKDHDWSQLSNIPFILGLARQYVLLGGDENNVIQSIPKIYKLLNSFQLTIEMDIKVRTDKDDPKYFMMAHLKGKAKIAPEFKYGTDSCYEWVIINDQPNFLGEPVKKYRQKIDVDLLANAAHLSKDCNLTYTGTKKWSSTLFRLSMNYCFPGNDTILLSGFVPKPNPMAGTWANSCGGSEPGGIFGMDQYFKDLQKVKEKAESGAIQQQANEAKKQAEEIAAQMKSLAGKMGNHYDPSQIKNYQKILNKVNEIKQKFTSTSDLAVIYIDFPLDPQNKSNTLFKKQFDVREVDPLMASKVKIDHGYYTVDIEYKP